jgi:hypothetical protein
MQGGHRHQRTLSRRVGPLHPAGGGASAPSTASAATLLGASAVSLSVASEAEWGGGAVAPALPITPSSCPSLSGQLLRQSLSRYLRTQVMHAHSAVVLFGFNSHDFDEDEDIPIRVSGQAQAECNCSAGGQQWQTVHSLTCFQCRCVS